MIAVAVLVAVFLLIGFAVIATAFAGRRRPSRRPASRGANRAVYIVVGVIVVAIGIAIPVLLTRNNRADASKSAIGGVELTSAEVHGRQLFAHNCATCHTLKASNAVGKIGPNLDVLRPPAGLVENAVLQGRARGNGNMPAGLVSGPDAKAVAAYVAAVAGR